MDCLSILRFVPFCIVAPYFNTASQSLAGGPSATLLCFNTRPAHLNHNGACWSILEKKDARMCAPLVGLQAQEMRHNPVQPTKPKVPKHCQYVNSMWLLAMHAWLK